MENIEQTNASIECMAADIGTQSSPLPDHLLAGLVGSPRNTACQNATRSSKRNATAAAVQRIAPQIIEAADGTKLLSAVTIQQIFAQIGEPLPYRCAKAMGSAGLKLPSISIQGKRRYALHLVENTEEEKVLFQTWLDGLDANARRSLKIA